MLTQILCFQVQNTAFQGGYGSSFHFRNTCVMKVWGLSFHIWNIYFPGGLGCYYHNTKTNFYSREFSLYLETILLEVKVTRGYRFRLPYCIVANLPCRYSEVCTKINKKRYFSQRYNSICNGTPSTLYKNLPQLNAFSCYKKIQEWCPCRNTASVDIYCLFIFAHDMTYPRGLVL